MTPLEDTRSDPRILSTKRPLHVWSLIGASNSEAPKSRFLNVCSEIITFYLKSIHSQACTPINDSESNPRILSMKQPLHFWSSIGVSISEAPKPDFLNVCSEIITFFRKLTSVYRKSMIPIEDWRYERRILLTRLALNFASAIGLSIFEAPKAAFSNVYSEITMCS